MEPYSKDGRLEPEKSYSIGRGEGILTDCWMHSWPEIYTFFVQSNSFPLSIQPS